MNIEELDDGEKEAVRVKGCIQLVTGNDLLTQVGNCVKWAIS